MAPPPETGSLLALQGAAGNRAVSRALAGSAVSGSPVQRLIADAAGTHRMFVPSGWLDTKLDERVETVREARNRQDLRGELLRNVNASLGPDVAVTAIDEVAVPLSTRDVVADARIAAHLAASRMGAFGLKRHGFSQVKSPLAAALQDQVKATVLPAEFTVHTLGPGRPMIRPQEIVASPPGIGNQFPITKACALIAVVKSYGANRAPLDGVLGGAAPLADDWAYYVALHRHYFVNTGVDYTEPSTHPGLFSPFGFQMVFSGLCSFADLPHQLSKPLRAGADYIFDIEGHSVLVRLKGDVTPGVAIPDPAKVFTFHSDGRNFNLKELNFPVKYIFERG